MRRVETELPGVLILEPQVFGDDRGFFFESYHLRKFAEMGITVQFVQDNHSGSGRNTVRGLHYQLRRPQAKLCRVIHGAVLDVAVDIRRGSPSFGKWLAVVLSAENRRQIFIPHGFAHGFAVLTDRAEFLYKCDAFYDPGDEHGIAWDDPALGIEWGVAEPILSNRDRSHPPLAEIPPAALPTFTPPAAG